MASTSYGGLYGVRDQRFCLFRLVMEVLSSVIIMRSSAELLLNLIVSLGTNYIVLTPMFSC